MPSDTLKRHLSKHRELHTLDEEEIRDVLNEVRNYGKQERNENS